MEILIVVGILAILAAMGFGIFRNFVKNVEFESVNKIIIADLKEARAKSISGEEGLKWGIHFVNSSSDYYELFSTPTNYAGVSTTVKITTYLPTAIVFTAPSEASSTDVIFNRVSGAATSTNIIVSSSDGDNKTITITSNGNVY